jgi:hypothetical protein
MLERRGGGRGGLCRGDAYNSSKYIYIQEIEWRITIG